MGDGGGDICLERRLVGGGKEGGYEGRGRESSTCSEAALVDPGVHVCALVFELGELVLRIFELVLEVLDLVLEGSDGLVEGLRQRVWCGLQVGGNWPMRHVARSYWRASRCRIVPLVARRGWSVGMQFVLRVVTARVLSIFERWTLLIADAVGVV